MLQLGQIDRADEEARLLDLDLAAEMAQAHDELPFLGEIGDGAIEVGAELLVADPESGDWSKRLARTYTP